ncbi:hypothetical protein [Sporomusa aerivorans]
MLHHAYVVNIRGDSYRIKERKAAGLYQSPAVRSRRQNSTVIRWLKFRPAIQRTYKGGSKWSQFSTGLDTNIF